MDIILWTLVTLAVVGVIVKKVRDFKKGKFCSCGCENCLSKCKLLKDEKLAEEIK